MERPSYTSLTAYFKGQATDDITRSVESWKRENLEEFEELKAIWEAYGNLASTYEPDLQRAWQNIDEETSGRQSPITWIYRIAASLLLVLGALWLWQSNRMESQSPMVYEALADNLIVDLSDDTRVTLANGATLSVGEDYGTHHRQVELVGKGFFEVASQEALPFEVQAGEVTVVVRGTSFQVESNEQQSSVIVTEGTVVVSAANKSITLTTDEGVTFDEVKATLTKTSVQVNNMAWKTGVLAFVDVPLRQFVADVSSHYGVNVELSDELWDRRITTKFVDQPLSEVFHVVEASLKVRIDTLGVSHFRIE